MQILVTDSSLVRSRVLHIRRWQAVLAVLLLRVGLQLALLHEAHDEIHSDQPILCPHCAHVVPSVGGNARERSDVGFRLRKRRFELLRPMADLENRDADAGQRQQIALNLLKNRQRQHGRSGGEVEYTMNRGHIR